MKQLYEVGEVVILESKYFPEYNGEYVILDVCFDMFSNMSNNKTEKQFAYYLGFESEVSPWWKETSLRKKHEPSQQSFKDLMTTLKSPQKVEWD